MASLSKSLRYLSIWLYMSLFKNETFWKPPCCVVKGCINLKSLYPNFQHRFPLVDCDSFHLPMSRKHEGQSIKKHLVVMNFLKICYDPSPSIYLDMNTHLSLASTSSFQFWLTFA
ncbi:hypothetical protein AAHE18_09G120200 [Arachis hypogaea]